MPVISTWWPLTGRLLAREVRRRLDGSTQYEGQGSPSDPVRFLPLEELGYSLAAGEEMAIRWIDVDWDARQAYVAIEGPQSLIDHLATLGINDQGPDGQAAPRLDTVRCQALLDRANVWRQASNAIERGKPVAERLPDLPMLTPLALPGEA